MKKQNSHFCLRFLAILLCLAAVITSVPGLEVFADENGVSGVRLGKVTGNGLNLREEPGSSSEILTVIPKNTKVAIADQKKDGWIKVMIGGYIGYVSATYVDILEDADAALSYGKLVGEVVYIRKGPGTSYQINAALLEDSYVKIVGIYKGWFKVETLNGKYQGYMHPNYLIPVKKNEVEKDNTSTSGGKTGSSSGKTTSANKKPSAAKQSKAYQLIEICKDYIGVPYVWGGESPKGFDCGGYTMYCYKKIGIKLPHTKQINCGKKVSYSDLSKGDLVFFSSGSQKYGHVGIYISGGRFIHAPSPGNSVCIDTLASGYYYTHFTGARRVL